MLPPLVCFLVDDDMDDQEIFALALSDLDISITCVTANNAQEALAALQEDRKFIPDFIFLDLNMPRINGRQCLVEIKKQPHLINIPVVIYSTSGDPKDKIETLQAGAAAFITKPSDIDELATMLSQVFIKHRLNSKTLL